MRFLKYIFCLVLASVLIAACKKENADTKTEPEEVYGTTDGRTVLVYMVSDNDMANQSMVDLREMLAGAKYIGKKDHLVVYLDDTSLPRIYDITAANVGVSYKDLTPVYSFEEEVNSCSRQQLAWVLDYVKGHYPAKSYGMVMWSHGSGWIPSLPSTNEKTWGVKTRVFGMDYDNNVSSRVTAKKMDIADIRDAMEGFDKVDYLIFDVCFMQSVEVLYTLKDVARVVIGSPAEVPGDGAPYNTMMRPMFEDDFAEDIVLTYYTDYKNSVNYGILLSAVDCEKMEAFAQATRPYIQKYKEKLLTMNYNDEQGRPVILDYYWYGKYTDYGYPDYYDMRGLMRAVLTEEEFEAWEKELYKVIITSVYTNVWYTALMNKTYKTVDGDQYGGITMHVPLQKYVKSPTTRFSSYASSYYDTEWAQAVWE